MQRIVLTGGPGAGKTSTLDVLRKQGYATGDDAARSIIRERKRAGLPPRPDALTFAQQVFEKEVKTYHSLNSSPSFFERGIVEAVGSLFGAGAVNEKDVNRLLRDYRYQAVFIFPPWEEIYCMDDERDHTFDHSIMVYESTLGFYRQHKYEPIEVPVGAARNRADFILDHVCEF
ncbi:MAG: AAA family ATPase [Pseudomonadales bacterium]